MGSLSWRGTAGIGRTVASAPSEPDSAKSGVSGRFLQSADAGWRSARNPWRTRFGSCPCRYFLRGMPGTGRALSRRCVGPRLDDEDQTTSRPLRALSRTGRAAQWFPARRRSADRHPWSADVAVSRSLNMRMGEALAANLTLVQSRARQPPSCSFSSRCRASRNS